MILTFLTLPLLEVWECELHDPVPLDPPVQQQQEVIRPDATNQLPRCQSPEPSSKRRLLHGGRGLPGSLYGAWWVVSPVEAVLNSCPIQLHIFGMSVQSVTGSYISADDESDGGRPSLPPFRHLGLCGNLLLHRHSPQCHWLRGEHLEHSQTRGCVDQSRWVPTKFLV